MNVLDAAFHAVHDYPGGAAALGPRMGKRADVLCHELKAHGSAKFGLVDAVKVSHLIGTPAIAQAFCAELGGVFLPAAAAQAGGDLERLGTAAKEFGVLAADYAAAVADGRVTANEAQRLERDGLEVIAAITQLLAHARGLHEQGKPVHLRGVRTA